MSELRKQAKTLFRWKFELDEILNAAKYQKFGENLLVPVEVAEVAVEKLRSELEQVKEEKAGFEQKASDFFWQRQELSDLTNKLEKQIAEYREWLRNAHTGKYIDYDYIVNRITASEKFDGVFGVGGGEKQKQEKEN